VDSLEQHTAWMRDVEETQGIQIRIPLIADPERRVAALYDMVHPNSSSNVTVRTLFVLDQNKKVRLTSTYPTTTGRNFHEVLRTIDSLKLADAHDVVTPAGWERGDDVIINPALSDEAAQQKFACGWRADRPYLRYAKDPSVR
jgi:alkyl hydroperoxide reductase subunit AhpC